VVRLVTEKKTALLVRTRGGGPTKGTSGSRCLMSSLAKRKQVTYGTLGGGEEKTKLGEADGTKYLCKRIFSWISNFTGGIRVQFLLGTSPDGKTQRRSVLSDGVASSKD